METDIAAKLERLGLTRNEARVYLALLGLGPTTTKLLIDISGVHTSKVYESLERLVQKGLASFTVEANRKRFQATDPQSIIFFLEEKEAQMREEKAMAEGLLPSLRSLRKPALRQSATVFHGAKGYKAMLDSMLREIGRGGSYDAFASGMLKEELGAYWHRFQAKKKQMKIKSRCIWDERVRHQKKYLQEYSGAGRFIPGGSYRSPTDLFIYKGKILLVSYASEPIFAVLIESDGMAQAYRDLFDSLWRTGKP